MEEKRYLDEDGLKDFAQQIADNFLCTQEVDQNVEGLKSFKTGLKIGNFKFSMSDKQILSIEYDNGSGAIS